MGVYKSKNSTKDGRCYFFRIKYKDIFGETHDYSSPKYLTRKEALTAEAKYRLEITNQKKYIQNKSFKEIYNEYMNSHSKSIKKQTIRRIEVQYKKLKPIENIKINNFDLDKYKSFRLFLEKEEISIEYKNKIQNLIKILIKYSNKYYSTNDTILKFIEPFSSVNEPIKEMQFYTLEEYQQFDSIIENRQMHTFFETLYFMGLRQGEIQALKVGDIDFNKSSLSITKTLTSKIKGEIFTISAPKTKSSIRTLPIPKRVLNDLKIQCENKTSDMFVFSMKQGYLPIRETTISKYNNKYAKLANLKHIRIHDFRHSCASLLINKGASIVLVSKYLGHSKVSMTLDTYSHLYKSELLDITNEINNIIKE